MGTSNSQRHLSTVEDHPNAALTSPQPPAPPAPKKLLSNPVIATKHTHFSTFLTSFRSTPPYSYICHVENPQKKFSQTLTLDFPSASIKSSTYVTSPTTNQIPDDTYTKGEKPRKQWEFRTINNRVWSLCLIRKPRNTPCSLNHKTGQLQVCSNILRLEHVLDFPPLQKPAISTIPISSTFSAHSLLEAIQIQGEVCKNKFPSLHIAHDLVSTVQNSNSCLHFSGFFLW